MRTPKPRPPAKPEGRDRETREPLPRTKGTAEAVHGKVPTAFRARSEANRSSPSRPASSRPASYPSPTGPVLRANPCPEVTDPICRLPLPTLFYRLEAVHLGDLLRISVRSGTRITPSPQDFQGPTAVHRTPREARCFTGSTTLSPGEPLPGSATLTKKRELFPGLPSASPGSFALPHWTPRGGPISVARFRNIDLIPFR